MLLLLVLRANVPEVNDWIYFDHDAKCYCYRWPHFYTEGKVNHPWNPSASLGHSAQFSSSALRAFFAEFQFISFEHKRKRQIESAILGIQVHYLGRLSQFSSALRALFAE